VKVEQIDKEHRPDLFYLEDPLNEGVFDQVFLEETVSNGKGIKRRAKASSTNTPVDQMANAYIQTITGKDYFFVDLFYDGQKVATYGIQPQYWMIDHWEIQEVTGEIVIDNVDGKMTCSGVQGGFSWDVEINFGESTKWSWNITAPGFTVRLAWIIEFTALGQQMLADGDLQFGYDDFTGNVSDDEGVSTRTIIFEPDGIDATSGWVVDPYLSVTEEATYFLITGDGYKLQLANNARGNLRDIAGTEIYGIYQRWLSGGSTYSLNENSACTIELLEDTPTRVLIRQVGNFYETTPTVLSNSSQVRYYWYIYPDRIAVRFEMDTSGSVTCDNIGSTVIGIRCFLGIYDSNATNQNSYTCDGNSETDEDAWAAASNYQYVLTTSDEINVQAILVDNDIGTATATLNSGSYDGDIAYGFNNGGLGAASETQAITIILIVDSVERAATSKIYDSTDRLAMGVQYTSGTDATINTGTAVTDMVIPDQFEEYIGLSTQDNQYSENTGSINGMRFLCGQGGSLAKIEIYFQEASPSGNARLGVYSDNAGVPNTLLLDAGEVAIANGWVEIDGLELEVENGTYYWLAFTLSAQNFVYYLSGQPSNSHAYGAHTYGALPSTFPSPNYNTNQFTMRATIVSHIASDGARYVESDSNDAGKITFNQAEKKPALVIPNWTLKSGSGLTEHLSNYFKMDDSAASTALTDETGNSSCVTVGDNTADMKPGDSVRGTAIATNGSDNYINLSDAIADIDTDLFTVSFKFKPNFTYNSADIYGLFTIGTAWNNKIEIYYNNTHLFTIFPRVNGSTDPGPAISQLFTSENDFQQYHQVHLAVDVANARAYCTFDTQQTTITLDSSAWASTPTAMYLGATFGLSYSAYSYDEVKLYNACILPFGAYHIGNGQGLLADISDPHSDLTFFWDCQASGAGAAKGTTGLDTSYTVTLNTATLEATTPIVGTNVLDTGGGNSNRMASVTWTSNDIINLEEGSFGMWINPQEDAGHYFFGFGGADDRIEILISSTQIIMYYYVNTVGGSNTFNTTITSGVWHWVTAHWKNGYGFWTTIDGVSDNVVSHAGDTPQVSSGTIYIGARRTGWENKDCLIGNFYISNKLYTPQVWTNFGQPLWLPEMRRG